MQTTLVMTLIGPDRTGLVEDVARIVASQGGNWLESRMCRLGGEFAGILRVETPVEKRDTLMAALQAIPKLQVIGHVDAATAPKTRARLARLELVGTDRPGIVREITGAMTRFHVNVEEFSSELLSAPMSGQTLFKASACLSLPSECPLDALKKELETIASDLLVDLAFSEMKD